MPKGAVMGVIPSFMSDRLVAFLNCKLEESDGVTSVIWKIEIRVQKKWASSTQKYCTPTAKTWLRIPNYLEYCVNIFKKYGRGIPFPDAGFHLGII